MEKPTLAEVRLSVATGIIRVVEPRSLFRSGQSCTVLHH